MRILQITQHRGYQLSDGGVDMHTGLYLVNTTAGRLGIYHFLNQNRRIGANDMET